MAQTLNAPLNVQLQNGTQLTQQIQNSINAVGFNFGGAKGLRSLSQPLGRLTGQADEFTKSLDAANARVLAFGASVGVVNAVSNAFKALVNSTIEVEKAITQISVVGDQFSGKSKELSQGLFNIAKNTGQAFSEVSKAALEFSRQGLSLEQTLARTQDALILTRTTGLDAAKSVDGLTAAVNAFSKAGLSTTQILNKLAAVDQAFAVSSADLIEAFQRTGAVAQQAGVSFDELAGIVTALQTETSRGGAVIGNALKTIFSRLQDTSTLTQLQNLGVAVQDLQGNVLPARQILQNLAGDLQGLSKITQAGVFKDVAGTFQLNQLVSLVNDLNKAQSISAAATQKSAGATNEAFVANEKLNQSLDAILNKVATTGKQLGSLLGEIGLSDNLKGILDGLNSFLESANNVLQGDDLGSKFAKGFVKGIGAVLSGPGLGVFLAIIVKLSYDLLKFGAQSLKTFFNIGKAANDQKQVQESIVQTLLKNQNVLNNILSAQGGQNAQGLKFLGILNQQAAAMQAIQSLAGNIAGTVYSAGYRQTPQGLQRRSAGGYLPAQEAADVRRGVGGASPNSKVVAIPNFAFGGGKRGTMIANTSEYIVPNYAGGGSAIFNQDMVKTMGLPAGAKKIGAAGGFIPNFALVKDIAKYNPRVQSNLKKSNLTDGRLSPLDIVNLTGNKFAQTNIPLMQGESALAYENRVIRQFGYKPNDILKYQGSSAVDGYKIKGDQIDLLEVKSGGWNSYEVLNKFLRAIPENYGTNNVLDRWTRNKDSFSVRSTLVSPQGKNYKPTQAGLFQKASRGYIPNFANYIYDADRIPSAQRQQILQSILDSAKRKNLLVGPAGSGKSTAAAGMGTFIKSLDDLRMASSFTILSSSGLSSKGGLTEPFQNILSAVNRSGGKTTYLGATNEELKQRRASRTLSGGDFRSAAELSGSAYAPLNQSSFIKQLKKESGSFEMMRSKKSSSATGFTNDQLAILGLNGQNGNINGSPVFTLSAQRPNLTRDIQREYEVRVKSFVRSYSQELANKIGIKRSPKEVKKAVQQSASVSGFIFEDVLNQLSGGFNTASLSGGSRIDFRMTPNLKTLFKTGDQKYAEAKLNPYSGESFDSIVKKQAALASGRAFLPQENIDSSIKTRWSAYKARASKKSGFEEFNSIARALNIDPTRGSKADVARKIENALANASTGYIPNFAASALQQAIAREKSAGLSDSQIYIDQNPSLKSPLNPMGLMVANTRDEPFGGVQGISRARKEGANPKLYGAANGFVPNYVNYGAGTIQGGQGVTAASSLNLSNSNIVATPDPNKISDVNKGFGDTAGKIIILQSALTFLTSAVGEGETSMERFTQQLAQSAGNITSLAFLGKDIKGINIEASGVKGALGKFAKNAGLAGIAIGVAVEGFNLLNFAVKEFSGENQKAALASAKLADASDKLSIKFDSLSKTRQTQVSTQTEKILGSAGYEGFWNGLANFFRSEKIGGGDIGANTEVKKGISQLLALGASQKEIEDVLGKSKKIKEERVTYASQGGVVSYMQSKDITQASDIIAGLEKSMTDASGLGKKLSDKFLEFSSQIEGIDFNAADAKGAIKKIQDKIYGLSVSSELTATLEEEVQRQEQDFKIKLAKQTLEFEKPINVLKRTLGTIIFKSGLAIEKISQQLERESQVINAITSSKSFATLGDSSRIAFEINSSINQFQKQYQNQISKFTQETQKSLLDYIPQLGIGEENSAIIKKQIKRVGVATTPKELQKALNTFQGQLNSFGVNLDLEKFAELKNKITETVSNFDNLNKNLDVQSQILALQNQERILEAQAYDTYRKQLGNFVDGVVKSEKSLIALRGAIERIDVSKNQNIEIRSAYAKTTADTILIRMEEEISALNQKRDKEIEASFQEAQIAAQREFFTKENIAELNRNTVAIEKLTSVLSVDLIRDLDSAIVESIRLEAIDSLTSIKGQEKKYSDIAGVPLPEGMTAEQATNYLKDLKNAYSPNPNFIGDGGLQNANQYLSQVTDFVKQGINANQGFGSIQSNISGLGLNQSVTDKLTKYAEDIFNAAQKQSATWEQSLETARATYDSQLKIYEATNSYVAKLDAQRRSLVDSLTDPQTLGEYNTKLRQINRQDYESALPTDQARQAYRSSFGYGFSEAMDAVEQRTLDFRNQLGKEIPDLFSQNLAQGLNDAISGAKTLKEALMDAATSFFQEITKRNISNLADLVTGGIGGFFTKKASGGLIKGGSGTKDDVPAMLMGGEYVVKKSAVNKYGKGFLDAINNGNMRGYATGGIVDPQTFPTQTGRGGFFTPGDYGQGAITGKNELLTFATQSFTGGQYDYMGGLGMSGATVSLEPESARLSALGREGSPMFERVQQSKDEAFRVYLEGLQKEKEYADLLDQIAKDKKARKKALQTAIISAVISSATSYAGSAFSAGAKNATAASIASGGKGGFMTSLKGGVSNLGNIFKPSKALGLSEDAKFLQSIGVNSYRDLSSGRADLPKFFDKYQNLNKGTSPSLPLPTFNGPVGQGSVGTLLPSFTPFKRASGGLISGGSNIRDDVPAMLTGGEFVLNNRATQRIGLQNLNKLNSGAPISSEGSSPEMTQALISKLDELIQTTANSSKENVVVNVSTNETTNQTAENPAGAEKELQKKIREAVLNVIAQEKRLGGSLTKAK